MPKIKRSTRPSYLPKKIPHELSNDNDKYNATQWRTYSTNYRKVHNMCEAGLLVDDGRVSEHVDHIIPISRGGSFWDQRNHMALSSYWHSVKSGMESRGYVGESMEGTNGLIPVSKHQILDNIIKQSYIFLFIICLCVLSCGVGGSSDAGVDLVKKRISQKIDADAMGMIDDYKIEDIHKVNDTVYQGVHSATNPMFGKEIRLTRLYTFTVDLDSITKIKKIKTEMKSEGEWVETSL